MNHAIHPRGFGKTTRARNQYASNFILAIYGGSGVVTGCATCPVCLTGDIHFELRDDRVIKANCSTDQCVRAE